MPSHWPYQPARSASVPGLNDGSSMIIDPVVAAPHHQGKPAASGGRANPGRDLSTRHRGFPFLVLTTIGLILIVGGIAAAWWHWREKRSGTTLATIEAWIGKGQYGPASTALREHLRRVPNDGPARMMLARVLAGQGDLAGCTRELHQVPSWWPRKTEALYREGQAYLLMDRAKDAEVALLAAMDADPLRPADPAVFHDASQELLSLYATENRWHEAQALLWKVYDRAAPADRPTVLAMRIQSELERIAPVESIKRLSRSMAADTEDWEARRALANAELTLGQHSEALQDMRACLAARPEDARVWRDYLIMLRSMGELDAFNAALARVPSVAETEPEVWIFRGQERERAGDWAAAASHFRRALRLDPHRPVAHYRLSAIEGRLGHPVEAAAHRQRWQELQEARGELRRAFESYLDAQQHLPDDSRELLASLRRLASLCRTLGWTRDAEGWSRLAVP